MNSTCEICGNAQGNRTHLAREMMFGSRDEFTYLECAGCGCLQLATVPGDMGRYYGSQYYSVSDQTPSRPGLRRLLKSRRTRAWLGAGGLPERALLSRFGPPGLPDWVRDAGLRQDSRILEVGCGTGSLLLALQSEGFTRLTGADPFVTADIDYGEGLRILKSEIADLQGAWDCIVLEHAFEHIPDPHGTLRALARLLAPGGVLVIGIPLATEAWRRYGVDWVQLDAPRHLFLHTERSFRLLCRDLAVVKVVYDSGPMQFWGSEQYRQGIALMDPRSYRNDPDAGIFAPAQIEAWRAEARALNARGAGDQAVFHLRRKAAVG